MSVPGTTMQQEDYQGYLVESAARGFRGPLVRRGTDEFFEFTIHVTEPTPYVDAPLVDRSEFAEQYGRRWRTGRWLHP